MTAYLIVGGAISLPVILGILLRVSASHLFFSVMAGELIARYFGHETYELIESVTHNTQMAGYAEPILLTIPVILTAVFLKGTLSKGKTFLHIIPFVVTGVVYMVFLLPILPGNVHQIIMDNPHTAKLSDTDSIVIGVIVALQLIALWTLNRGGEKHGHGKHKKD